MKVKICGITNLEDALLCEIHGSDMLGFIFYKESKRYIPVSAAKSIMKRLSLFTIKIGVFVNQSTEEIISAINHLHLNGVQLHGDEDVDFAGKLDIPVIKAFRVSDDFSYNVIETYKNCIPLLDTHSNNLYGGTGKTFNWQSIPDELRSKIILAGGISENNIEQIYSDIKPMGVDISSSLEEFPGKKSEEKVKSFFNKLNQIRKRQW